VGRTVDVVIRSAGAPERRTSLQRAIRSVLNQQSVAARPIIVLAANLPNLAAELAAQPGVKVHHVGQPASPGRALGFGRRAVETDYYGFLDDDDELLPHALATGLEEMRAEPETDLVVTTGYWFSGERRQVHIPDIRKHQDDPISGILERCWLHSCGGLYRAATVTQKYFDDLPDLCEWTYLAFRLALDRRNIRFLDVPTYNAYDTPGSMSKGAEFMEGTLIALDAMRAHSQPAAVRAKLEQKYRAALHDASEHYWRVKQRGKAWLCHLKSLKPPHTLRYLAYTRKLVRNRDES
jgi:glycosyl transferase family 2